MVGSTCTEHGIISYSELISGHPWLWQPSFVRNTRRQSHLQTLHNTLAFTENANSIAKSNYQTVDGSDGHVNATLV